MTLGKLRSKDQVERFKNKHEHLFKDFAIEINGF